MNLDLIRNINKTKGSGARRTAGMAALALLLTATAAAATAMKTAQKPAAIKSVLPAKYAPIIKRSMFGFLPRKEGRAAPASGAPVVIDTPPRNPLNPTNMNSVTHIDIPVNAAPEPAYSLTGIVEVNGEYKAIIEDRSSGRGFYVSEGSSIGEYKAAKITSSGVSLEKPDKKIDLQIDASNAGAREAGGAPGKSELTPYDKTERHWLPPSVAPRLGGK